METATDAHRSLYLVFHLDDQLYGVPVSSVREILQMVEITPLPNSPAAFQGVINLRGVIVPIVDLRRKLRLADRKPDDHTCLVIADAPERAFGFMADRVTDCARIGEVARPQEGEGGAKLPPERKFIHGVGQRDGEIIILLALENLLTAADRKILKLI